MSPIVAPPGRPDVASRARRRRRVASRSGVSRYRGRGWPRRAPGKRPVSVHAGTAPSNGRAGSPCSSFVGVLALVTLAPDGVRLRHAEQRVASTPVTPSPPPTCGRAAGSRHGRQPALQQPVAQVPVTAHRLPRQPQRRAQLNPSGRQANEGLLARLWHRIAGTPKDGRSGSSSTGARARHEVLDVGAPRGTDVYAPVAGTIAAISDFVIDGRTLGRASTSGRRLRRR